MSLWDEIKGLPSASVNLFNDAWTNVVADPFLGGAEKKAAQQQATASAQNQNLWTRYQNSANTMWDPLTRKGGYALDQYTSALAGSRAPNLPGVPNIPGASPYNSNLPTVRYGGGPSDLRYSGQSPAFSYSGPGPRDLPNQGPGPQALNYRGGVPQYQGGERFQFSAQDLAADPSYQFRLRQGEEAMNRAMAASGNRVSGNRLTGLMEYGQGMASQEYGNAYGRALEASRENYGRGLTDYGIGRENEATAYARAAAANQQANDIEAARYGRAVTANELANQNEAARYGRALTANELATNREQNAYARAVAANQFANQNEATRYGRAQDAQQVAAANEQTLYNRQMAARDQEVQAIMSRYGLDYQRAMDLYSADQNKLAQMGELANLYTTGLTAQTNAMLQATGGKTGAIQSAADATAAAKLGQANAYRNMLSQGLQYAGLKGMF